MLFAYDGLEGARAAIRHAGSQLERDRRAIVLTVWEPPEHAPVGRVNPIERNARRVADEGAQLARVSGFNANASAERGDPIWERIVEAAEERDASVVVLGAHARNHTEPAPIGSVVAAVTEHTERPVLVVHARPPRPHG